MEDLLEQTNVIARGIVSTATREWERERECEREIPTFVRS